MLLGYDEPVIRGKEAELHFDIHDLFGREVEIEPFLGADMHLAIIKENLSRFIHIHPAEMEENHHALVRSVYAHGLEDERPESLKTDEEIAFHVVFPEAGLYKLFAQFRPLGATFAADDEALTAAFWAKVEERSAVGISAWWRNLLVSALAIAALGFGVRRFLRVGNE